MKATISSVTRATITNEKGQPEVRSRVIVRLDDDLATLLGTEDLELLLTKELVYFYSVAASAALITASVRNDISVRKRRALTAGGRLLQQGLVGKEFDL